MANVHYADLKPLVNSYIQQLVQIKWDVIAQQISLSLETNARATEEIPELI